jgi:hypothetical protein
MPLGCFAYFYDSEYKRMTQDRAYTGIILSKPTESTSDKYTLLNTSTNKTVNSNVVCHEFIFPYNRNEIIIDKITIRKGRQISSNHHTTFT